MPSNTIYVIGPKSLFDTEFALYQQGRGWYYEHNFKNFGSVRNNLDETLTLLEEEESKFNPEHLAREDVFVYTHAQIREYLIQHLNEWELPYE